MKYDAGLAHALERLGPHDHLCSIYESPEEHFAVAVPFIRIGLERHEKCLYITEAAAIESVRAAMREGGIDVESATNSGALQLATKDQTYMQRGSFDPDWMFTFWQQAADEAQRHGFTSLRATGETEWVVRGGPGLERWMEYESRLTHTLAGCNAFALCQYNRRLFRPALVLDIIRTHPIVIYGRTVCRNFYFVPPGEYLCDNQSGREMQRLLENIRDREWLDEEVRMAHAELEQRVLDRTRELRESEEKVRHQNRVLDGMNRIFGEALYCDTEAELGRTCLAVAEMVTQSRFGFLAEINAAGHLDAIAASDPGWAACCMEAARAGTFARVFLEGRGFSTNDPSSEPDSIKLPDGHPALDAFLGVPLVQMGKVIGIVGLGNREGGYRQQDLEAVEALALAIVQVLMRKRAERALRSGEERLREAQKMESIGVLAGGIAHDFNNLLTGVLGSASLALETMPARDRSRPLIEAVMMSATRAADLTRQLLAYAGKGHFIIQPVNLSRSVREMMKLLRGSVPANVTIDLNLQEDIAPVEADVGHIQQIIMNLILNASEAIGDRPGQIVVRTRTRSVDAALIEQCRLDIPVGTYISLEVQDTGSGMDQATISKIFEPFFTTKFTGRGLGLAAVHGVVRAHKGAVLVYSHPGSGSLFTVLLPAGCSVATEKTEISAGIQDLYGQGGILVIDDEDAICTVAKAALERFGYRVLVARSGVEGLQIFRHAPDQFAAVVLDLTMPRMSGEETYQKLRAIRPDIPVLLSSGYNQIEVIKRFTAPGLADFIGKPYTASTLVAKVKSVCAGSASDRR